MTKDSETASRESDAAYMIAELQMVQQRASQYEQAVSTRTNLFLASLSIVFGGLLIALDRQSSTTVLLVLMLLFLGFFAILGVFTLAQVLDSYMSSVFLYRRMGRIRHYFVDQNRDLEKFMPFAYGDDRPLFFVEYAPLRGIDAVLPIVNSCVIGIFAGLSVWAALRGLSASILDWIAIVIGLAVALLAWWLQTRYIRNKLMAREDKEREEGKVWYPSGQKRGRIPAIQDDITDQA